MTFSYQQARPKILITGAHGSLARSIIPALENRFEIFQTDLASPEAGETHYLQSDLTDFRQVTETVKGVEAILHLAIASQRTFQDIPPAEGEIHPLDRATVDVNITGTFHVFEAARRAGVRRIVYASSLTAYLGNRHRERYGPDTPLEPLNLYACTKIFGENLGQLYYRKHNMSVITLRIGQPYPAGHQVLDEYWKTNRRARSTYIALEDIACAVRCGLETEVASGIYNIVSASDNPRVDLEPAKEIGYSPRGYFSNEGLSFHENGEFPPQDGRIVTQ